MAFHIFIKERVDVAVIEVGIGGEYDCTNVLRYRIFQKLGFYNGATFAPSPSALERLITR